MHPPDDLLTAWLGWWVVARCRCKVAYLPVKLLVRELGGSARLSSIVPRLRCSSCGERPHSANLVDDPQARAPGYVRECPGLGKASR